MEEDSLQRLTTLLQAKSKYSAPERRPLAVRHTELCGREWLFDVVTEALDGSSPLSGIVIYGEAGCGKTNVCNEFVQPTSAKAAALAKRVVWHWFCRCGDDPRSVSRFVRHLARDLCNVPLVSGYRLALQADSHARGVLETKQCSSNPDDALRHGVLLPLSSIPEPPAEKCLLIVDGVAAASVYGTSESSCRETARSRSIGELLANHRHLLPPWLVLLVTCRRDMLDLFSGFMEIPLDCSRSDDVSRDLQRYVLRRLDGDSRLRNCLNRLAAENINELRVASKGCFLYLELVVDAAVQGLIKFSDLTCVPRSLGEAFELWMEHACSCGADLDVLRIIFSILVAALHPLSETDLYEAVLCSFPQVTMLQLKDYLHAVARFILTDMWGKLLFAHPSFPEWLQQSCGRFHCDPADGHAALAMRYGSLGQALSSREVQELAVHATRGQFTSEMSDLLKKCWERIDPTIIIEAASGPLLMDNKEASQFLSSIKVKLGMTLPLVNPLGEDDTSSAFSTEHSIVSSGVVSSVDTQSSLVGSQALIVAAGNGDLEGVAALVDSGVDINAQDANGRTSLNIATREGHKPVVAYLVSCRANVDLGDEDGWTPLRTAAWVGRLELVVYLLEYGNANVDAFDGEGRSPLRAASWAGHDVVVQELISRNASIDLEDKQGRTPLIAASYMGHTKIMEMLLVHGANVNHVDRDGRSALSVASLCNSPNACDVVTILLNAQADVHAEDQSGMRPLNVVAYEGNAKVAEILLDAGADPNHLDRTHKTTLMAAVASGHAALVELLLFWSPIFDQVDNEGRSLLTLAASSGSLQVVNLLLNIRLDVNHVDKQSWTPLFHAVCLGSHTVTKQLIEVGAKMDVVDRDGLTPLLLSTQAGKLDCVRVLVNAGANLNATVEDSVTALKLAALAGRTDIVHVLVEGGADVDQLDHDKKSTLYAVACRGLPDVVRSLLNHGSNPNILDRTGRSPLHVAAWNGYEDVIQMLAARRANINQPDRRGLTPLHAAAWHGHKEAISSLLDWGAEIDKPSHDGATALGITCQEGHEQAVKLLLSRGANPFKVDKYGSTPLDIAQQCGHPQLANLIRQFQQRRRSGRPSSALSRQSSSTVQGTPTTHIRDHSDVRSEPGGRHVPRRDPHTLRSISPKPSSVSGRSLISGSSTNALSRRHQSTNLGLPRKLPAADQDALSLCSSSTSKSISRHRRPSARDEYKAIMGVLREQDSDSRSVGATVRRSSSGRSEGRLASALGKFWKRHKEKDTRHRGSNSSKQKL